MHDNQKTNLTTAQLTEKIRQALNSKRRLEQINFQIISINENSRGENFEIEITNEQELTDYIISEANNTVFAPVLSQFSLSN